MIRDGILTLTGYGLRLWVERGHLHFSDGVADERRTGRFSRVDKSFKRLLILGESGTISLDAVGWLHRVGVPLIHIGREGTVLQVAAPAAATHAPLRRAQAEAASSGTGLRLSIGLVEAKIRGHLEVLRGLQGTDRHRQEVERHLATLRTVTSAVELRRTEGHAGGAYWSAWRGLPVPLDATLRRRAPTHWRAFEARRSPMPGSASPRRAVDPINAILNYCYALLEAEARVAALAVGLDPVLGLLHTEHPGRDALALDLMEPIRPAVDAYVLELLAERELTSRDVYETREGQCRLLPQLTQELAVTVPRWAQLALPVAQGLRKALLEGIPRGAESTTRGGRRSRPQMRVTREFTPRLAPEDDPRYGPESVAKRQRAVAETRKRNRRWRGKAGLTREEYLERVVPGLREVPLSALMKATGLTNASCSRIRRGLAVPHERHWGTLASIAGS